MDRTGPAIREHADGCTLEIRVHPSSSRLAVEASYERISVFVHSPPERGKANREALKLLAGALGTAPSRLELLRGRGARDKTVLARGISPQHARELLA